MVYPFENHPTNEGFNELEIVYDHGKVKKWDYFQVIRKRVNDQWNVLPPIHDPISKVLANKIEKTIAAQSSLNASQI